MSSPKSGAPYHRVSDDEKFPPEDDYSRRRSSRRRRERRDQIAVKCCTCCGDVQTPSRLFATMALTSLIMLILMAVALSESWYLGSIDTVTQGKATTTEKFFMYVDQVEIATTTTDVLRDWNQVVASDSHAIMTAERVFVGISLFCVICIFVASSIYAFDGFRHFFANFELVRMWSKTLPTVFAWIIFLLSLGSVLIMIAIPHAAERDDFIAQITGGAVTCSSGLYDCGSFWRDHVSDQSATVRIRDQHRPSTSWFVMIITWFFAIYLVAMISGTKKAYSLEDEFAYNEEVRMEEEAEEEEDARRRDAERRDRDPEAGRR